MELADCIKSNKSVVDRNSILISKLNPSIKRFWLPTCWAERSVCSTEFFVYKPLKLENKCFYAAASSPDAIQNYLQAHVT